MLNPCSASFLNDLEARLPLGSLRSVEPRDLSEPRGRWQGLGAAVARPKTAEELSVILRACQAACVPVVPYGGGTGLVGGQIYPEGPVPLILSLERMRAVRGVWPDENAISVEAGMTLAEVHAHAENAGRIFPLDLASEGSATIGGNLATNAGGTAVLRYGVARDLCLGIEAVMPDGGIFHGLKRLRKDNTGYDLRNLLIGSEGTLGVITAASLRLYRKPAHRVVAMLAVPSVGAAQRLLRLFEAEVSGLVSGFELISAQGFRFLQEGGFEVQIPFSALPEWVVLVELGLPRAMDPDVTMAMLYEMAADQDLVSDGVIARSEAQADQLWAIRELIPSANKRVGAIASHDISLPLGAIEDFIRLAGERISQMAEVRINCFGHLGDGNLHYNLFPTLGRSAKEYSSLREDLSQAVNDLVLAYEGSISAEHGIGRLKRAALARSADPARLKAMREIKQILDPNGIMNPGSMFE